MKYAIVRVCATFAFTMENEVNKLIEKGWEPLGGICFVRGHGLQDQYAQAMIKRDDNHVETAW